MKDKIIDESVQLFDSKGFSETSVQDIVDALNVTKGTFYYYFESKEQLLMNIQTMYIDDLLEKQRQILACHEGDFRTAVTEVMRLLIREIKANGRKANVFFRELVNLSPENLEVIKGKRQEFRMKLQTVVSAGIESKAFRQDLRADMVTFAILGICNWTYKWFNPNGPVSDEQLAETYIELILGGIEA